MYLIKEPRNHIGVVSCLRAGHLRKCGFYSWQGQEIYLFCTTSRPALRPIQHSVQWVQRAVSVVIMLTIYLHLVWRLIHGAIPPISICLHGLHRGNFTFYLYLLYLLHPFKYTEVVCEVTFLDVCTLCTCGRVMLIEYRKNISLFSTPKFKPINMWLQHLC